jgi:phytoene dehydrogenase-like protein
MAANYDALVIGAGHNGLVAAGYLARAGKKVLVVERRRVLGGAAATEEIFPGFRVNTGASDAGRFLLQIVRDLGLEEHGLRWLEGPALIFAPQPDGTGLTLWRDVRQAQEEIARFSPGDAQAYPAFLTQLGRFAGILQRTLARTPPALPGLVPGELLPWLPVGLDARRMGRQGMMDFIRALPMPAAGYLDEWFESPALKGALGMLSVTGSIYGPQAAGTALKLFYQASPYGPVPGQMVQGGAGGLSEALSAAARARGAEICLGSGVERILLKDGRAAGVVLDSGQELPARVVLSSANPRHTFFDLIGASHLELRFVRELKNIRFRGGLGRVNLALQALPVFNGVSAGEQQLSGRILICPNLQTLERAADDAKYGRFSRQPCLDLTIPTVLDGSLAPAGQHLMCINVQYAPYHLSGGGWDEQRQALFERVLATLTQVAPGLAELILHHQVLTPLDLERQYGLPEGSIDHGEMALDQLLFMRPVPSAAQYRTPTPNLYLCGAGAHPGGGLTGAAGFNAARVALQDLK